VITVATLIGHLIPLIPFVWLPRATAVILAFALSALVLFGVGVYSSVTLVGDWRKNGLKMMVIGLGAALYSQFLGLTFLVGAFYCGLLITPESAGRRQHRTISFVFEAVTWGFFIPLFFALVGFNMDFRQIGYATLPILAFLGLVVFALFSKVFVGTAVARTLGWSANEAICAGFLVSSRGAVELAMAVILLGQGIISTQIFTVVAGVGLMTTFLSPIGAKPFVRMITSKRRERDERSPAAPLEPSFPPRRITNR